ncbi:MAG: DUF1638 domain-containing protein [Halieaceae bacterium]
MPDNILVIACGALAREIETLKRANQWQHIHLQCLDAALHNTPDDIPDRVDAMLEQTANDYAQRFVAYADCGTGGRLDAVLAKWDVARLPGAHCYEFYATPEVFHPMAEAEPGSFYLTDFLVRHFDRLVVEALKLRSHPELRDMLFGHYTRVVYLAQTDDPVLREAAARAADRLALPLEVMPAGMGLLESSLAEQVLRFATPPEVRHAAY